MTVKELIKQLQQLDPDLRVFTRGYEGGYEDVCEINNTYTFHLNHYKEWYMGPHERIHEQDSNNQTVKGIIL